MVTHTTTITEGPAINGGTCYQAVCTCGYRSFGYARRTYAEQDGTLHKLAVKFKGAARAAGEGRG